MRLWPGAFQYVFLLCRSGLCFLQRCRMFFFSVHRRLQILYGITQIGIVIATMTLSIVLPQYLMIRLVLRRASARPDTISSICLIIGSPPFVRKVSVFQIKASARSKDNTCNPHQLVHHYYNDRTGYYLLDQ
jgi:hypothetical protein